MPAVVAVAEDIDAEDCHTPSIDSRPVARPHWRTPPPAKGTVAPPPSQGDRLRIWRPQASLAVARPHWRAPVVAPVAAPAAPMAAGWAAASDEDHRMAPQPAAPWPHGLTEIHRFAR